MHYDMLDNGTLWKGEFWRMADMSSRWRSSQVVYNVFLKCMHIIYYSVDGVTL